MLWGVIIGLAVFALWWFKVEPVYGWVNGAVTWADSTIKNLNLNGIVEAVTTKLQDPIVLVPLCLSVGAGILGLYERSQRIKADHLKLQAQEAELMASRQLSNVTTTATEYKNTAESALRELSALKETNPVQQLETAKQTLLLKQGEILALQKELEKARKDLSSIPYREVPVYK